MESTEVRPGRQVVLDRAELDQLIEALRGLGYDVLGPTVRDGAIVYDEIGSTADLPVGVGDVQDGGSYRLTQRGDGALFGYSLGPQSWKKYPFPPQLTLWRARVEDGEFEAEDVPPDPTRRAFFGMRPCELRAMAIQDRVFMGGSYVDSTYATQRAGLFIVAVNCAQAGGTCFCVSMGSGPNAQEGYDIALTEVIQGDVHFFVAESGSQQGDEVLASLPGRPAGRAEREAARTVVEQAAAHMGREMPTEGLPALLQRHLESTRWEEIANRCLSCANCTLVCPTCFCNTVEDVSDLEGREAARVRRWDSCFSVDFSYIHGGSVRVSPQSRYRQWMTHKLSSWWQQFDSSGCVGCGRCITWCPVGIDITEEVEAFRLVDLAASERGAGNGNS